MGYMRSNLAFGLFWVNLIIASLNIYFGIEANDYRRLHPYSYNLRGTKEKILERNPNYFLEKEFQNPKILRNLLDDDKRPYLIYIDIGAFLFIMMLVASFCVTQNECCTDDANTNANFAVGSCYGTCVCCADCRGDCNCNCSGGGSNCGEAGIVLLILAIFIIVFIIIFFLVKACGKHGTRIVSIIGLILVDISLVAVSLYSGFDLYCDLIAGISFVGVVCNFLGLILPNLDRCAILSYDYKYPLAPINQTNIVQAQVYTDQPQNEKPLVETYPEPQEVIQVPISEQEAPIYSEQYQGYDNNPGNGFDAPAPVYQQPINDVNNQVDITYPSPQ